jgi:hypothetical protein
VLFVATDSAFWQLAVLFVAIPSAFCGNSKCFLWQLAVLFATISSVFCSLFFDLLIKLNYLFNN